MQNDLSTASPVHKGCKNQPRGIVVHHQLIPGDISLSSEYIVRWKRAMKSDLEILLTVSGCEYGTADGSNEQDWCCHSYYLQRDSYGVIRHFRINSRRVSEDWVKRNLPGDNKKGHRMVRLRHVHLEMEAA